MLSGTAWRLSRSRRYRRSAACPQYAPFDDRTYGRMLQDFHPVAWRADENLAFAPLSGPDSWRNDWTGPRIPVAHGLGGGGQNVDVGVEEYPVLLGDQCEVGDSTGDGVVRRGRQDVDFVRDVVVGLLAGALSGMFARMAGELAANQVQIVR